jgi:hypothetical protein
VEAAYRQRQNCTARMSYEGTGIQIAIYVPEGRNPILLILNGFIAALEFVVFGFPDS